MHLHCDWIKYSFLTRLKCKCWDSRAFLVKVSIISLGGPHPALLQALTSTKYWVSGRRFSILAEYSWLLTWILCAAASLSWADQYRICEHSSGVTFCHDSDTWVVKSYFQLTLSSLMLTEYYSLKYFLMLLTFLSVLDYSRANNTHVTTADKDKSKAHVIAGKSTYTDKGKKKQKQKTLHKIYFQNINCSLEVFSTIIFITYFLLYFHLQDFKFVMNHW